MKTCIIWTMSVLAFYLQGCGQKGGKSTAPEIPGAVQLQLGQNEVPHLDSMVVSVAGSGMETLVYRYRTSAGSVMLENIAPGADRLFRVEIFAGGGVLVQQGEAVSDVPAAEQVVVNLDLQALAGFLAVEIPLGLENASGVHSGRMVVVSGADNWSYTMQLKGGKGYFYTGALPLKRPLSLTLELFDAAGNSLFNGSKELSLMNLTQTESLILHSTRGLAQLVIRLANMGPVQLRVLLPLSGRRVPAADGEIVFSEIFPWPKSGGDHFEYLELYNTTLDTLDLDSCRVAKSRTTAGTTTRLSLPDGLRILPMSYFVLGRDSALFADFNYANFAMGNSGQELLLICRNALLDSLYYALPGDTTNPFPLVMGSSLQLPLENWKNRRSGKSWCTGNGTVTSGSFTIRGTPGGVADCQPD